MAVMYRLNLAAGQRYELKPGGEEMNGVCIKGAAGLELAGHQYHCGRLDSFYTAGGNSVAIEAEADCVFYIGASVDEGYERRFSGLLICSCRWVRFIRFTERARGRRECLCDAQPGDLRASCLD
ncbi:MAG: hypothetical protein ACLTW9_18745 [Enterocloster sp.]